MRILASSPPRALYLHTTAALNWPGMFGDFDFIGNVDMKRPKSGMPAFRAKSRIRDPFAVAKCQHWDMRRAQLACLPAATVMTIWVTLLGAPPTVPSASAAACPDVEVTFRPGHH